MTEGRAAPSSQTDAEFKVQHKSNLPRRLAILGSLSLGVAAFTASCTDTNSTSERTNTPVLPPAKTAEKTPESTMTALRTHMVKQGPECEVVVDDSLNRQINGRDYWEVLSTQDKTYKECVEFKVIEKGYLREVSVGGILYGVYLVETDNKTHIQEKIWDAEDLFQKIKPETDETKIAILIAGDESLRARNGDETATVTVSNASKLVSDVHLWQVDNGCGDKTSTPIIKKMKTDPKYDAKLSGQPRTVESFRGTPIAINDGQCDIKPQ